MNIELKVKRPKRKKQRKPLTKEQRTKKQLRWIVNVYRRGDLDLNKSGHLIPTKIAIHKGMIPKEVLTDERYYQ